MTYKLSDLINIRGHLYTSDKRYFIAPDGTGYHYWHRTRSESGSILKGCLIGSVSYGYVWPTDKDGALKKLNNILTKRSTILTEVKA